MTIVQNHKNVTKSSPTNVRIYWANVIRAEFHIIISAYVTILAMEEPR